MTTLPAITAAKYTITRDGLCFRWLETGPRGGTVTWYAARQQGQAQPSSRALWCRTQREARENEGAANVAANIR